MPHIRSLTTEDIWRATAAERAALADLLAGLTEEQWDHQSLCAQWRVRDVVAHVVQTTRAHLGWILVNLARARGNADRALCEVAIRHADRVGTRELLAELRASVPARFAPISTVPADRLLDVLVHAQDVAVPLGIEHPMPAAAAKVALQRVWATAGRFGIAERLAGVQLVATDAEWSAGEGVQVHGTAGALLLLATGRPADGLLTGPGAAVLADRR
ncbi:maleylpyruvate isomerase family mycothiol-dependent enzyme [Nocardia brasiliensis]|uniref:maleylpyruvate isomerase family mycothiol-dependent enzyme n=1 Tax=Nocardia brasiliensis TaxID=37326 RepID=UPI002455E558|nr:maleylpyruvate isomerase family mycothiol-dependent enzyme [Nocardia brasiliensis]